MKDNFATFYVLLFYCYLITSQICTAYFWYDWSQEHNFVSSMLIGPFVAEFKGLLFPFFI